MAGAIGNSYKNNDIGGFAHKGLHGLSAAAFSAGGAAALGNDIGIAAVSGATGAMTSELVAEALKESLIDQIHSDVELKRKEVGGRNLTQKEFIDIRESRIEQTKNLAQLAGSATGLLTGSAKGVHQASHSSNTALTHNFNTIIRASIPIGVVVNAVGEKAAKVMTGVALGSALKDANEKAKQDSNSLSSSSFPTPYDSLPNSYLNEAVSSDIPESDSPVKEGKQENMDSARHVDLTDTRGRRHILEGDGPNKGGGHRAGTGKTGKSEFPKDWSDDKIIHEISDVATDPSSVRVPGRWGTTKATGVRDGVKIETLENGSRINSGYPTNLPKNLE